jgi:hypothetical protein
MAAALVMAVSLGASASAATGDLVVPVTVLPRSVFVDAGIALRTGERVTINASGRINFGGPRIAAMTPSGIAWGPACEAIARRKAHNTPWPAPGLQCWSLVGRIGSGPKFEIGTLRSLQVTQAGELFLGVNDNDLADNTGTWSVTVTVSSAARGSTSPAKSGSGSLILLAIAAIPVLAIIVLVALWWRGRGRRAYVEPERTAEAHEPREPGELSASPFPAAEVAKKASYRPVEEIIADATPPPIAPPEADSIDVNIFEVEFADEMTLTIGYNHFPDGTPVEWRVTQNRTVAAAGSFVAKGGGSTSHVETVPLGVQLEGREAQPDGADVLFNWKINGVPFQYSVRREPPPAESVN